MNPEEGRKFRLEELLDQNIPDTELWREFRRRGKLYTDVHVDAFIRMQRRFHYQPKNCFANCQRRAFQDPQRYCYVEGLALSGLAFANG